MPQMKAAVLISPQDILQRPLRVAEVPRPAVAPGHVLLRVRACGVCRTDLHIVEGELPPRRENLIPGHQIVGEIDGTCWYCQKHLENLCDSPTFTGYTVDGGYAEYALARSDFVYSLPSA